MALPASIPTVLVLVLAGLRVLGAASPGSALSGSALSGSAVTAATTAPLSRPSAATESRASGRSPNDLVELDSSATPSLSIVRQSWTVGPGQNFSATVSVTGAGSKHASSGSSTLGLVVTVFARLHTRTALAQTIQGTVTEPTTYQSATLPLTSLASPAPEQYQVNLALQTADSPDTGPPPGVVGPAPLSCAHGAPGSCGGVYPVQIQLVANQAPVDTLTTELVYVYPTSSPFHATSPLRVALVAPLTLPTTSDRPPTGAVNQLDAVATALTDTPGMPLTVVSEASALDVLAAGRSSERKAAAAMVAAMTDPAHETVSQGYVPVDAGALVDGGLGGDLAGQVAAACSALASWHPTSGIWVTDSQVGPDAATDLADEACDPIRHIILPADAVGGGNCTITCAAPFDVTDSAGTELTAVEADSQLTSEITAPSSDPALRAHDLLADLSLTYFEAPTPAQDRGVVLAIPFGNAVSPSELADLISGMVVDPVLDPVTVSQYFASVPVGANGQLPSRKLLTANTTAGLPVRALRQARTQLVAYGGAVDATAAGQQAVAALDRQLLGSESSLLRPVQQQQAVGNLMATLRAQLRRITLPDSAVRLTSSSVLRVPITLGNSTGFPVAGRLVVSSDKLLFSPSGSCRGIDRGPAGFSGVSCAADLTKTTDAVYVAMRPRIGGDFRVMVSFWAPDGKLALVHGEVTVRSLSTSVEAIVLSVLAVLVLLGWWIRTHRKSRHRARHGQRPQRLRGGAQLPAPIHPRP